MKSTIKALKYSFILIFSIVFLAACSLFPQQAKEEIDPPRENVSYEDDLDLSEGEDGEDAEAGTVQTELYLIDKNGYVVPQTFALPNTESLAKQALEHLVIGGPIEEKLPSDFRAVLPADTQVSVDIQDGVATVDFSKEFADYAPEDELKILQAITYTLTQFDTVDRVKLQLNGNPLTEMPVNGTPINGELTRNIGINIDTSSVADITNTESITVYYLAQANDNSYYVPVTKRVKNENKNPIVMIVDELIKGPKLTSELYTLFMPDVALVEEPMIEDGVVTLNFNENIYGSYEQKLVTKQVLESLVLSLTEQEGIEAVSIQVNGETDLVNWEGESIAEPVTRPKHVNTGSF